MTTMLEQMARAIADIDYFGGCPWDEQLDIVERYQYLGQARAALEVLRKPTGLMMDAGEAAGRYRDIKPGVKECLGYDVVEVWQAILGAVLKEADGD